MRNLAIWGASGHGRVVADIIRTRREHRLLGFIDDAAASPGRFCDLPLLGPWASARPALEALDVTDVVVAIGDCDARARACERVLRSGFVLAHAVHPSAVVASGVEFAPGLVVVAGAVINAGARLGQGVIVNTSASVDHDCVLADGVHVSPGARLGGNVTVGQRTWIGIGATIRHGISIGARSIVGAGSVVVRDLPDEVVAYGVPARVVSSRTTAPRRGR